MPNNLNFRVTMAQEDIFKKIISHCKEYGFVFPSSDIYDGLAAVYDYGQNGVELKNNIKEYWWKSMVLLHENIVGIDSAIFMHPTIWKASGHVDAFNDPLIDNKDSKKRYRADVLIEDQIAKYEEKIDKEVAKAAKRFGESFDKEKFLETNARVLELNEKKNALHTRYAEAMQASNLEELKQIIVDEEIVDPISGTKNWTDVRQFNLMFSTEMGSISDAANKIYLRPETAQGIFVNYLNVQKTGRMKLPFGFKEVEGVHSRTNFDLSQHEKFSGKSIKYFDPQTNESYVPYVIETSIGVDRMFLSIMCHAYTEETLENGETRVVLKLPAALAPVKLCVMPLVKKDGLPEKAREIVDSLKFHFNCHYEEKDSIGKRYRRHDAIGTPYCVTVDHDTLKDNKVTLRFRDTMEQERVDISELRNIIEDKVSIVSLLKKLQ